MCHETLLPWPDSCWIWAMYKGCNNYIFLMWSKQSANSPWKWIRVKMVQFKSNAIKNPLKNTAIHSYFGQLIAKKSKNNSKTTWSIVCSKTLHWCNVYWQRLHTYILMAAKSSVIDMKSKHFWSENKRILIKFWHNNKPFYIFMFLTFTIDALTKCYLNKSSYSSKRFYMLLCNKISSIS